jgi:hypothetical protein
VADSAKAAPTSNDLVQAQIQRLLSGEAFRNAELQRRLLGYIASKSLAGEADALKEYTIGVEVLGKADYDPARDSSVRMQVARLREKLAKYYRTDGVDDPIIVDLPKGHFKMVFQERVAESSRVGSVRTSLWKPPVWLVALALIGVGWTARWGAASLFGWESRGHIREIWTPALEEIWQPFLISKRPVLVSLGTPLFIELPSIGYFRFPGTDDVRAWQDSDRAAALSKAFPGRSPRAFSGYAGVGEAAAAFELAKLLGTRRQDVRLVRSSLLSWDEIAVSDVIFVGPPKYNLQLKEIPIEQEYLLETKGVRNLNPQRGEPSFWEDGGERHALITRIPGLRGNGEILVFASNSTSATMAAVQYMAQGQTVDQLQSRIRNRDGTFPPHYQVILRVQVKDMTPVQVTYLSHHVLEGKQKSGHKN